MATFQYKALQADGSIAEGEMEAGGRQEAFRQMEGRGLRPIRLAERSGANGSSRSPAKAAPKLGRVSPSTPSPEAAAPKANGSPRGFKLSFGGSNKVSARMLENFTRLLS